MTCRWMTLLQSFCQWSRDSVNSRRLLRHTAQEVTIGSTSLMVSIRQHSTSPESQLCATVATSQVTPKHNVAHALQTRRSTETQLHSWHTKVSGFTITVQLRNVLFVPEETANLFFNKQAADSGANIVFQQVCGDQGWKNMGRRLQQELRLHPQAGAAVCYCSSQQTDARAMASAAGTFGL